MDLGRYDILGEYCGPHTASSVFLILVPFEGFGIVDSAMCISWNHIYLTMDCHDWTFFLPGCNFANVLPVGRKYLTVA